MGRRRWFGMSTRAWLAAAIAALLAAAVPLAMAPTASAAVLAPPGAVVAMTTPRDTLADPTTGDVFVSADNSVDVFGADGSLLAQIPNVYGAAGMALDGSGSLWVAESTAAKFAQISLSTLAVTNTYATGIPVSGSATIVDGGVWFPSTTNLGRFDLAAHTTSTRGAVRYANDQVLAVPGAHELIDTDLGITGDTGVLLNVAANPATTVATGGDGVNLSDLAISADGSRFWSASGGVYSLAEYTTATLQPDGVNYTTGPYPSGVAYSSARGGVVAVDTSATDKLDVASVGDPTAVDVFSLPADPAKGQIALSSDATRAYVLVPASGGFTLDTFALAPTAVGTSPSSVVANVPTPVTVTGTGLGVVSSATVGGIPAPCTVQSATQITLTMPNGLASGSQPVVVTTPLGTASTLLNVQANTGGTLSGTVSRQGAGVAGVQLTLAGGALSSPETTASSTGGSYAFADLGYGTTYTLTVHDPNGTEPDQVLPGITVTPNNTISLSLQVGPLPAANGAVLARQGLGGAPTRLVVDPTTGRVFVSAGNEVDAFDANGNLLAHVQGQTGAAGLAIGGSTLYVDLPTAGAIDEIDIPSLTLVGALPVANLDAGGYLAYATNRLFYVTLTGVVPSLNAMDPVAHTVTSLTNWSGTAIGPVSDASNLLLSWDPNVSPETTDLLTVTGASSQWTFASAWNVDGPGVASTAKGLLWGADGVERTLSTLEPDGVSYPTNLSLLSGSQGAVGYSSAYGGLLDFGADVDLYGTPAIADQLPDSPTNSAFNPSGDRLYYTTDSDQLVVYDLHPYLTSIGSAPIFTDVSTLPLTGQNLGSATAVTLDGTPVPFTETDAGDLTLDVAGLTPGSHSVAVTTAWGTSTSLSFSATVRPPTPVVSSLSPSTLPTAGGTLVITGSHLTAATGVTLAGVAATSFTVVSDTEIDALVGPHTALSGPVVVSNVGGANSTGPTFAWVAPLPAVTSMSPSSGFSNAHTTLTLSGTGFTFATGVSFGGISTTFTVINDTTIAAVSPVHSAGAVTVAVTTAGGTSVAGAGATFTYVPPPPVVTGLSPASGSAAGGYQVVISGSAFTGATAVSFGAAPAASFVVVSDTSVVAVAPPHLAGAATVSVTTPSATSVAALANRFTYTPIPTGSLSGTISSSAGPLAGMVVVVSPASSFQVLQTATTAADGTFTVSGLPVGSYRVLTMDGGVFFGVANYYLPQWYDQGGSTLADFATATVVSVGAGTTTALDPILLTYNQPGSLSGSVASSAGPLANMLVAVYNTSSSAMVTFASTDASGHYSIGGLAPGTYRVAAIDWAQVLGASSYYVSQFYAGGGTADVGWATATNITVTAGATMTLPVITLAYNHPGTIAGLVTKAGGTALPNMLVAVYNTSSSAMVTFASTDASGHYSIGGLAPGTYRVAAIDWAQVLGASSYYVSQFYAGGGTADVGWATATNITVTAGATTTLAAIALAHHP